jgi:simple sugar transport system permease protein
MKKMKHLLHAAGSENLMLISIGITAFTVLSILMPYRFFSLNNVNNMLFQAAELGILSIAMALPIIIAGIDLSIVSNANLTAICIWHAVRLIPSPALHLPAAVMITLVLGTLLGAVNGLLTAKAKIPPILATLGTMTLYSGISVGITGGATVAGIPPGLKQIGTGTFLGLPLPIYVLIACFLAAAWILNRTPFGFKMYLLGCNSKVTRFSGYNNDRITIITYILSGLLAAAAGFVILCRSNSAYADYGKSYITLTILIVVLGGIAVTGGKGKISGVVLAVFLMQVFSTGFNMLLLPYGNSNFFKDFLYGVLLIAILVLKPAVSNRFGKRT